VNVFTCPDLHAKVFILGKTAVVGSTNASSSSELRLREAVVETTDPQVRSSAKRFIETLESHRVGDFWLSECQRIYKKPTFGPAKTSPSIGDPEAWCRRVMRLVSRRAVTHDGRNRYYISPESSAVKRASLRVDDNEEQQAIFLLSLHPGDTSAQANELYATSDENRIISLVKKGWVVYPNLHFGFIQTGLCWIEDAPMNPKDYIRFWKSGKLRARTIWRDKSGFRQLFRRLRRFRLITRSDEIRQQETFTFTKRQHLQLRPGLTLQFAWHRNGKLPDAKLFAPKVRLRINQALKACNQPPI
jgi:hypothetical protein